MELSLQAPARRLGFAACIAAALAGFLFFGLRAALAHHYGEGLERWQIERAVKLEPQEADYWYRLGRWQALMEQDDDAARLSFQQAARLNPGTAATYMEIARLDLAANNTAGLMQALQAALRAEPNTPSVRWEAANLYLAAGDMERSLPMFRSAILLSRENASRAMVACWIATRDVDQMIAHVLPPEPEIYGEFLRYLVGKKEAKAADQLWQSIQSQQLAVPVNTALPYVDSLLAQQRVPEAVQAWNMLAQLQPQLGAYRAQGGNLVVNPGFEQKILNGGFDWKVTERPDISVETAHEEFFSGAHSLAVAFSMVKTNTAGVEQQIPVEPQSCYTLSFAYKSEGLEGARGIFLTVRDTLTGQQIAAAEEIAGTNGWRKSKVTFDTPSATSLVTLDLSRPPGTLIRGKFWIDDVQVVKQCP